MDRPPTRFVLSLDTWAIVLAASIAIAVVTGVIPRVPW